MNNKLNTFETERLLLKPTSKTDDKFIFELFNSPKWIEFIGDRNIKSVKDAEKYIIEKIIPQKENSGLGTYTVITKNENKKIGTCGLYNREGVEGLDLGFAFLPEFERNGFAFEASEKIVDVAFNHLNLNEIKAITVKENTSSQKLLEKLKFELMNIILLPNNSEELLLYLKTRQI
ncbi:MAG: GNAT family N-acetyltransferase [Crocinitomicaceae bacterium]